MHPLPAGLKALVTLYDGTPHDAEVRFRPATWEDRLADVPGAQGPLTVLRDESLTHASKRVAGDRVVDGDLLGGLLRDLDLDDAETVATAFLLVQVWGSGTSGSRTIGHTRRALTSYEPLVRDLRATATMLRSGVDYEVLAAAHKTWKAQGVGQSFFTKWFSFAGHAAGRPWQPLILDERVFRTLNRTLDVTVRSLTRKRGPAAAYEAYVRAMHEWGALVGADAARLEWIAFVHNGHDLTSAVVR